MKTFLLFLIKRFMSPEKIARLLAGIIANLLRKASKTNHWDLFKGIIVKIENICHLFNEVYSDETLSKEDEERIATAIEQLTDKTDLKSIITKVDFMQ